MEIEIRSVVYDDEVGALLEAEGLPNADLQAYAEVVKLDYAEPRPLVELYGARYNDELQGLVGLEYYGDVALLRSLVVRRELRCSGSGRSLVLFAEQQALRSGAQALYLLTTTAADYFTRLGFSTLPRDEAPAAIAASQQFSDLCPSSASFMTKALRRPV
ncbi:MAG: arsenic resistance N-acetyltransferase ArsN2 [Pseudomonadota bacterium]